MSLKKIHIFRNIRNQLSVSTRWVKNLDGYNMFLIVYPFIIEALKVMALKLPLEKYPEWSKFDQESRSRANRALGSLHNFRLFDCVDHNV